MVRRSSAATGFALLIVAVATLQCATFATAMDPAPSPDFDILNFALNLEYLEAEFYSWAAFGHGLNYSLSGGGPPSRGGRKARLSWQTQAIAEEIANDEIAHVAFLRSVLKDKAVPRPLIDLKTSFAVAADAALNTTLHPPFSPYVNDIFFYHGAFIFEDVGVTAYKGAAPMITEKDYVGPAAGILAVEAYHAGIIRSKLSEVARVRVQPYGVPVKYIVAAISKLRATLSGADDDQGITGPNWSVNLVPTDGNSIVYGRTVRQVLNIVYGKMDATMGLFFPNGIST